MYTNLACSWWVFFVLGPLISHHLSSDTKGKRDKRCSGKRVTGSNASQFLQIFLSLSCFLLKCGLIHATETVKKKRNNLFLWCKNTTCSTLHIYKWPSFVRTNKLPRGTKRYRFFDRLTLNLMSNIQGSLSSFAYSFGDITVHLKTSFTLPLPFYLPLSPPSSSSSSFPLYSMWSRMTNDQLLCHTPETFFPCSHIQN